jgi:hypothetical protein
MLPVIRLLLVALLLGAVAGAPLPAQAVTGRWTPSPDVTWQVQLSGRIDLSVAADAFDLDMFDTTPRQVRAVHARSRRAVCYVNAGAWEDWRPDAASYPAETKGRALDGWPGERWLDIRRLDLLAPILTDRIGLCRAKGFDGVEFDNVDGYSNLTGFELSRADQASFNRWLAKAAHEHGLAAGLKNALDLAAELEPVFDFAIVEQCFAFRECGLTRSFTNAGKPVLDIEYHLARRSFCDSAQELGLTAMRKRVDLGAWRRTC